MNFESLNWIYIISEIEKELKIHFSAGPILAQQPGSCRNKHGWDEAHGLATVAGLAHSRTGAPGARGSCAMHRCGAAAEESPVGIR
jgi:hypothetical protein